MKKILAVLLILILAVSLVGCGTKEDDVKGTISTGNNVSDQETNESDDTDDTSSDNTSSTNSSDDNTQADENELSLGQANGGTYKNDFIGIGFNLPEGWTFYTEEEIMALNNLTADMLDEETAETLKNAAIIYDMYAQDITGSSVNVNLEKLSSLAATIYSEEEYIKASIDSLKTALTSMGFTDVTAEAVEISFVGETHQAIKVVCSSELFTIYEKIVCIKKGQYMACITVGTAITDETDTILNQFYSLN